MISARMDQHRSLFFPGSIHGHLRLTLLPRVALSCGTCCLLSGLFDPQETQLGAEVGSVSDVGEEVFGVTGGAERHAGPLRHSVVVDVFGQDSTFLEEDPAEGDVWLLTG